MATYAVEESKLTAIADAIRLKRESVTPMEVDDMPLEISLIDGGSGDVDIERGTLKFDVDTNCSYLISHSLGKIPRMVFIWAEDLQDHLPEGNLPANALISGINYADDYSNTRCGMFRFMNVNKSISHTYEINNYSASYTTTKAKVPSYSQGWLMLANVTYNYIIVADK